MSSPFLRLRRAASTSASSLSGCCSSSSSLLLCGEPSAFSYPYPRHHTTLMVLPAVRGPTATAARLDYEQDQANNNDDLILSFNGNSTSNNNEGEPPVTGGYVARRPRPPLNRAIPPIPESKSNESIISAQSAAIANRRTSSKAATPLATPNAVVGAAEDRSVVIENRMAQNLGARADAAVVGAGAGEEEKPVGKKQKRQRGHKASTGKKPTRAKANAPPPKSPLVTMAQSISSRISRLGQRLSRERSQSPSALPSSRSLTIPKAPEGTAMPKSTSLHDERSSGIPRRLPTTLLIPGRRSYLASPSSPPHEAPPPPPEAARSVQFSERQPPPPAAAKSAVTASVFTRAPADLDYVDLLSITSSQMIESPVRQIAPPLASHRVAGHDLWQVPHLRKTPRSFPPMPESLPRRRGHNLAGARSAMSVSFSHVDHLIVEPKGAAVAKTAIDESKEAAEKEKQRRIFSTRSLRLAASKLSEASPRLMRRRPIEPECELIEQRKAQRAEQDKGHRSSKSPPRSRASGAKLQKSQSIPEQPHHQSSPRLEKLKSKLKKKSSLPATAVKPTLARGEEDLGPTSVKATAKKPSAIPRRLDLRAVKSPESRRRAKELLARLAPLAAQESTRVENSPAVEVPPVNFQQQTRLQYFREAPSASGRLVALQHQRRDAHQHQQKAQLAELQPRESAALRESPEPSPHAPPVYTSHPPPSLIPKPLPSPLPPLLTSDSRHRRTRKERANSSRLRHLDSEEDEEGSTTTASICSASNSGSGSFQQATGGGGGRKRSSETMLEKLTIGSGANIRPGRTKKPAAGANGGAAAKEGGAAPRPADQKVPLDTAEVADPSPFPLPELISDFKAQLSTLQQTMKQDFEEMDTLRLENEALRLQLAEREQIIASLQTQLAGK